MKYKILLLSAIGLITHVAATNAAVNDRPAVIYPLWIESAPTDADVDAANWYLKNFTTFNSKTADNSRSPRGASDNDYKSRLKDLSKQLKMDLPYNDIVKKYIEQYVMKNRTQVSNMLGLWPYYKPIFENAIRSYKIPEAIKYLPVACSALNSQAISGEGSAGLWMFMVTPAKGNGLEVNTIVDERFDPYRSSEKAAEYLRNLYSSYHDWLLAIAAHTCGIGNVNKAIQRAKNQKIRDPKFWDIYKYLPKSTRGYVPAFIAACYAMNYFSEHDITPTLTSRKLETATAPVNNRVSIHQISQVLGIDQNEIRFLNPQYREEVNDVIVIPGNIRTYNLTLPTGQIESFRIAEKQIANYQKKQFARRAEVQPGDIKSVVGDEDDIIDDGIIYHEVTGIEDLEDIAKTYNVNINAITMTDGQSKPFSVEAGDIVLIHTKGNKGRKSNNDKGYAYNTDSNRSNSNSKNGRNNSSSNRNNSSGFDDEDVALNTTDNKGRDQRSVPQPHKNNQSSYDDYDFDDNNQSYDEDLERQQEAARKKAAEEAKKRKATEEAIKKKKAAEEAKKRKAAEDAAKRKAAEEAAKRKAAEEAAKKKAAEEAARKKAAEEAAKPIIYEVKSGNNLTKLAEQYGVTVPDILDANPEIKDGNIKIGQKIKIPKKGHTGTASTKVNNSGNDAAAKKKAAEEAAKRKAAEEASKPVVIEVKSGNNLTKLAEQYGVTVTDFLEANPEIKDGNIKIGQKIKIPKKGYTGTSSTRKVNNDDDAVAKKKAAEEAKKKAAEEAAKKKAAEEAAKKKAAAKEAAKKKELERKEAKKKAAEEAKKKAAEEAKKKAAEEAAKKKAAEEAAKKKAAEEAARKKAAEEAKKPVNHKVSDGENLTKIAKRYGVSVQELKRHNNITDENKVRSGSTLKIPKKGAK